LKRRLSTTEKSGEKYVPSDRVADGLNQLVFSDFIVANANAPALSLTASLSPAIVPACMILNLF